MATLGGVAFVWIAACAGAVFVAVTCLLTQMVSRPSPELQLIAEPTPPSWAASPVPVLFESDTDTGMFAPDAYGATGIIEQGQLIATVRPGGFVALEVGHTCDEALRVAVAVCIER